MIRRLASWIWKPPPPSPHVPTPPHPGDPKPSKFDALGDYALKVMFATPIPAAWDGEGIR